MTEKTQYLSAVRLLQDLSETELASVDEQTHLVRHQPGHLFYMPEDQAEVLFILKKGRVQLYRISPDGRKLIVAILRPGAIFGHMAIAGQGLHNTYAQAVDDCVICVWSKDDVERLLRQKPEVALRFLAAVNDRLTQVEDQLAEVAFKRVPARLAGLLLRLMDEHDGDCVLRGYTHQHLADILGTYRETVSQILNDFRQNDIVQTYRKRIEIHDLAALQIIAAE